MGAARAGLPLRDLTILAVVDPSQEERIISSQKCVEIFTQALKEYRANSGHEHLRSISLQLCDTIINEVPTQIEAARSAAHTAFRGCLDSLADADLGVEELDIFSTSQRGSMALSRLRVFLNQPRLRRLANTITRLQMSIFKGKHILPYDHPGRTEWRNAEDVLKLIQICPRLSTLHLHWYKVSVGWSFNEFEHDCQFFDDINRPGALSLRCTYLQISCPLAGELLDFTSSSPCLEIEGLEISFEHLSDTDFVACFNNIVGGHRYENQKQLDEEYDHWEHLSTSDFKMTEAGKQHEKTFKKKDTRRPGEGGSTQVWYRITWAQLNYSAASWLPTLQHMRLRGPLDSEFTLSRESKYQRMTKRPGLPVFPGHPLY